jgi:hypothetical protein
VLTADPSLVDDWSVGVVVRRICPPGPAPRAATLGVAVPAATMAALAGPAHDAYGTTTAELLAAATGADAVTIADVRRDDHGELGHHAEPGLARVGTPADDADLIRAVKGARRATGQDDPATPVARVLVLPDNAIVTALGDAGERTAVTLAGDRIVVTPAGQAELIRDRLVALVAHCVAAEPEYSTADFPDSGLDDDGVAALLAALDVTP